MYSSVGWNRRGSRFFKGSFACLGLLSAVLVSTRGADITWTNINGGIWSAATNWSPNLQPGALDNAYLTNPGTYTVILDVSPTVASLILGATNGLQTLTNSAQTLTLSAASYAGTNAVIGLAGGNIDGSGNFTVAGRFNWTGGQLIGSGKTIFTNTSVVTINGPNNKFFNRSADLYSTATWSEGLLYSGGAAIFTIKPGGLFDIIGDLTAPYSSYVNYLTCTNQGILRKSTGPGTASLTWVVNNFATVRSQSGTLDLPVSFVQDAGLTELAGGGFSGVLLDIQGGLLTGSGNIAANVRNGAQVAPGTGIGLMTISNTVPETYGATTNSLVTFQIGGINPGNGHDQLRINSTATLAGTLRAQLANGYIPAAGNTYTVMTFTARSDLITNFSFPDYEFGVVQTTTNIILIASNAIPALSLTAPTSQLVCVSFPLAAQASDLDGQVTNVQFLLNSTLIANFTNSPY